MRWLVLGTLTTGCLVATFACSREREPASFPQPGGPAYWESAVPAERRDVENRFEELPAPAEPAEENADAPAAPLDLEDDSADDQRKRGGITDPFLWDQPPDVGPEPPGTPGAQEPMRALDGGASPEAPVAPVAPNAPEAPGEGSGDIYDQAD